MNFIEKLLNASRQSHSLVCVGLDPDPELMPEVGVFEFNKAIIDATADLVCAYKPNLAFYEALGLEGLTALSKTVAYVPKTIPVIGDAKRGDIGNTARAYAKALFETIAFDAVTVNPYLGYDSIEPFLAHRDRGVFILCKTSNPGSSDFQTAICGNRPLYEIVAQRARDWNASGNVGLVVGATYPWELKNVRALCPDMPILIPGVGAQGGDVAASVHNGVDAQGEKAIINSSRQIIYASRDKDFAVAARKQAMKLRDQINQARAGMKGE
ncbi:MAG: orotidine-5'-phosphate decarboxylase [Dehalococcoidia bacterium]|nr:orotidine-5'-phosphate decarboxylase [Dehalococcoidia bacterium]